MHIGGEMDVTSEQEQRRYWRRLWLSAIQAFADAETQERRWKDPTERNPVYSYVECIAAYFDDAFMAEDEAYQRRVKSGRLHPDEAAAVADFHAAADAYRPPNGDAYAVDAILLDPAWQNVVRLAQAAQLRLLPLLADKDEKATLTQAPNWHEDNGNFHAGWIGASYVR